MRISSFAGTNKDFRIWLRARTANVVSLTDYRIKRKTASKRAAIRKTSDPIIA